MNDNYELVLQRLREEREHQKLTQQRLCSYMQIQQSNFSKAETGHRRFAYPEIKRLCTSDVDIFYIFTGNKAKNSREFPGSPETGPEELICGLNTLYVQARTARVFNRDTASFEVIQKQLEYIHWGAENTGIYNNTFRYMRIRHGYTQQKMSDILGLDIKKLQGLEKGKKLPDSEIIWKMYDLFHVSPAFILNDPKGLWHELDYMLGLLYDSDREIMLRILENSHKLIRQC